MNETLSIDDLNSRWDATWGGSPRGSSLRSRFPARWVRFHSLPGSKRYPENDAEYAEVLARHHAVIDALATDGGGLFVIARDLDDESGGYPPTELPTARLWRREQREEWSESAGGPVWATPALGSSDELDDLLHTIADGDTIDAIVADASLGWLYHPYDGGGDVIAASPADRDALRERFGGWLSEHPAGL